MKKKWLPLTIISLLGMIVVGFFSNTLSLFLFLSDRYFIIGLLLLIIGLFGLVLKQGTFDFFHYSLNKAKDKLVRPQEVNQQMEHKHSDEERLHRLSRSIPSSYTLFLKAGSLFLLSSILCLLLYFFQNN